MTTSSEQREREIVQLQRMIQADQPPGCLTGIAGYLGMILLFSIVGIGIGIATENIWLGAFIYVAALFAYVIHWNVLRAKHNKKKKRLKELLKEEQLDIERSGKV